MPLITLVFYMTLGSGTILTFLSSHWLLAWTGLEINAFAFIPIISQQNHPRASEAAAKYFLIQAGASAILVFASFYNASIDGEWEIIRINNSLAVTAIILSLALKIGVAPLHYWLPEVIQGLNLKTALILATWQKLAPLSLLVQFSGAITPQLLIILAITSSTLAGWAGINQTQLRKILAYSSTAHLGWVLIVMQYQPNLSLLALGVYILNSIAAFLVLKQSQSTKINTLTLLWSKSPILATALILALFSLAGLPPLTGFIPKWLILEELTKQQLILPAILIFFTALFSLYFYARWCYFTFITLFPHPLKSKLTWRRKTQAAKMVLTISTIVSIFLLPIAPFFWALSLVYN